MIGGQHPFYNCTIDTTYYIFVQQSEEGVRNVYDGALVGDTFHQAEVRVERAVVEQTI